MALLWPGAEPWTNQLTRGEHGCGNMAALPAALRVEGKGRAQEDPCLWKGAGPDQGLQGVCHSLSLVSGFPEASCWLPPCSSLQLEDLHPRLASLPQRGDHKKPGPQHQILSGKEHHLLPARRLYVRMPTLSCPWASDVLVPLPSALPHSAPPPSGMWVTQPSPGHGLCSPPIPTR